ncbi:porin [uncultured Succinatimonas sp.]|uniref:porin n=1 Tax=uncultured Succinatimonas sp. TaxID=1262973 RepID=UPI0025DAC78F|nr:porin [uncultured Succinatimonas sp.]
MKKSLLALAVASITVSSIVSAATVYDKDGTSMDVYGRIQAVAYSQDSANTSASGDAGIVGSGRLGIDVRTQLTDGIAAFGNVEWDVADSDGNDSFSNRYLWIGADFGQFGQLKAGRFEDAVYNGVTVVTDIFDDWGCAGQIGNDDKRDGMVMYSWSGYGVDFMATYGSAKDGQTVNGAWAAEEELDIKNSYSVAVGYTTPDVLFGPISVKAGYGYVRFQDDLGGYNYTATDIKRSYDNYKQWAAAISWGGEVGPFIAALYNNRDFTMNGNGNDYAVQGVEAVLGYGFDCGVNVYAAWEWMNIDYDGNGPEAYDSNAYTIPVYVNYAITPNFNVWVEARFDAGTDDDFKAASNDCRDFEQDVYSVGARYTF